MLRCCICNLFLLPGRFVFVVSILDRNGLLLIALIALAAENHKVKPWRKAVEILSGISIFYTTLALILTYRLAGGTLLTVLGVLLDLCFLLAFSAFAILMAKKESQCGLYKPLRLKNDSMTCARGKAALAASIIAAYKFISYPPTYQTPADDENSILLFASSILQIYLHNLYRREQLHDTGLTEVQAADAGFKPSSGDRFRRSKTWHSKHPTTRPKPKKHRRPQKLRHTDEEKHQGPLMMNGVSLPSYEAAIANPGLAALRYIQDRYPLQPHDLRLLFGSSFPNESSMRPSTTLEAPMREHAIADTAVAVEAEQQGIPAEREEARRDP